MNGLSNFAGLQQGGIKPWPVPSFRSANQREKSATSGETCGSQSPFTKHLLCLMKPIALHSGDLTRLAVDAIVNAANESLLGGGGVDGAIHAAAGPQLVAASRELAPCPAGSARMTPGFELKARYVIHAVGPVYHDGSQGEAETLERTYLSALDLADSESLSTVAFPCISTGVYGFPKPEACEIAINTVMDWQAVHACPETVVFCCFNQEDLHLYAKRLQGLGVYHVFEG